MARLDKLPIPDGFLLARGHAPGYYVLAELDDEPECYIKLRHAPFRDRYQAISWILNRIARQPEPPVSQLEAELLEGVPDDSTVTGFDPSV